MEEFDKDITGKKEICKTEKKMSSFLYYNTSRQS